MSIYQKSGKRSSRRQISIIGVENGVLVLPPHEYRMVLEASSINFELMSEAEQDVLLENYQSFLQSLPCPLQIVVRVREVDMEDYLEAARQRGESEINPVYQRQMSAYVDYVRGLIKSNKILSRRFYIVLSHSSQKTAFEFASDQLGLHADIISTGLAKLGMNTRQLGSLEILDLFYSFYSDGRSKRQPLREQTFELLTKAMW